MFHFEITWTHFINLFNYCGDIFGPDIWRYLLFTKKFSAVCFCGRPTIPEVTNRRTAENSRTKLSDVEWSIRSLWKAANQKKKSQEQIEPEFFVMLYVIRWTSWSYNIPTNHLNVLCRMDTKTTCHLCVPFPHHQSKSTKILIVLPQVSRNYQCCVFRILMKNFVDCWNHFPNHTFQLSQNTIGLFPTPPTFNSKEEENWKQQDICFPCYLFTFSWI